MRIVNENLETIKESEVDLTKGILVEGKAIREDAEPIDDINKFAWADDDYEDVMIYMLNKETPCEPSENDDTSVWDEFATQMRQQFSLPEFPVMYTTSLLCKIRNGWSFSEASPLRQVTKSKLPMLFIHGDSDTFVPTWMVHKLYAAKPEPKQLWIVPNTAHALSFRNHPEDYTIKVGDFLAKYKLSRPVDVYMR